MTFVRRLIKKIGVVAHADRAWEEIVFLCATVLLVGVLAAVLIFLSVRKELDRPVEPGNTERVTLDSARVEGVTERILREEAAYEMARVAPALGDPSR